MTSQRRTVTFTYHGDADWISGTLQRSLMDGIHDLGTNQIEVRTHVGSSVGGSSVDTSSPVSRNEPRKLGYTTALEKTRDAILDHDMVSVEDATTIAENILDDLGYDVYTLEPQVNVYQFITTGEDNDKDTSTTTHHCNLGCLFGCVLVDPRGR